MTLAAASDVSVQYTGNGLTTAFSYPYKFQENTDLVIYRYVISTGVESVVSSSEYTVTGAGEDAGGEVTFLTAPTSDHRLTITRDTPAEQESDYVQNDGFPAAAHEEAVDRIVAMIQEIKTTLTRTLRRSFSSTFTMPDFPTLDTGYLFSDGSTLSWREIEIMSTEYDGNIAFGLDANKSASPAQGDWYVATDTRLIYFCFVAGTWNDYQGAALRRRISKAAHGFVVGDVLKHDGTNYLKAQATSSANARVVGIVSAVLNVDAFMLTFIGEVTGLSGLVAGSEYYLSAATAGALTSTKPTGTNVVKPILIATSTTAGVVMIGGTQDPVAEDHYRWGLSVHWESSTDTIAIEAGQVRIGSTLVQKADRTTLAIGTAGNYIGGSSQRATNTTAWVYIDASGNIKLYTTAATHADFAVSTTTGKLRYISVSGTVYRVLGWVRMNGTGSGEIDVFRVGNILDVNTRNRILYYDAAQPSGNTNFPVDNTTPQDSEGTAGPTTGFVVGDSRSKVVIRTRHILDNTTGGNGAGAGSALFKSGTASAKRTAYENLGPQHASSPCSLTLPIEYEELAGAVGWQAWSLRFGQGTSTISQNTISGSANFNSTMVSTIEMEEVDP